MNYRQKARQTVKQLVRKYFKDDYGRPFEMTDGQADIFLLIYTKKYPRNQVIACTQYGKSDVIAMAVVVRSCFFQEPFAIIAGRKEKAQIIMSRVIQHSFDHPRFYKQLELDANMPLDRLRRERTKDNITWRRGGGVRTFTANISNRNAVFESLSGFGSPNIIEDESALINDEVQAMILRMLGGHKKNFLVKIGNPYHLNHFHRTWHSDRYHKLFIDYKQALKEGRYTTDFIEEMRNEPFFDILYANEFPDKENLTDGGYRQLITPELLKGAWISEAEYQELCTKEIRDKENTLIRKVPEGLAKLGADFAGGGRDRNAYVVRWPGVAKLLSTNQIADTMQQIPIIEGYIKEYKFEDREIGVDYGGLGQGIGDRLREKDRFVNCIMFGQSAPADEKSKYKNMRAYMYYQLFLWIRGGGKIVREDGFLELLYVNFKEDSSGKFKIQPKEDLKKLMKKRSLTATSPDIADAVALTFADNSTLIDEDDFDII